MTSHTSDMGNIDISVVVPVYNAEQYLEECIRSILSQSLHSLEVICVDDGSEDASADIIHKFQKEDPRVILLTKQNGGVSSARNKGIRYASGNYIQLMDSDDLLSDVHALEFLYEKAVGENLDQLFYGGFSFFQDEQMEKENAGYNSFYARKKNYTEVMSGRALFTAMQKNGDYKAQPCMQILRRQFLLDNNLFFHEELRTHNDEAFTLECTTVAERAAYVDRLYYARRVREGSLSTTRSKASSIYGYYTAIQLLKERAGNLKLVDDRDFYTAYFQRLRVMWTSAEKQFTGQGADDQWQLICGMDDERREDFAFFTEVWKYEARLKKNQSGPDMKKMKYLQNYVTARMDIKNKGTFDNSIVLLKSSDEEVQINEAEWMTNSSGKGYSIKSAAGKLKIEIQCIGDGVLEIALRSMDVKDENGKRIPFWMDYDRFQVNDSICFDDAKTIDHDHPYKIQRKVKDGEIVTLSFAWKSHAHDYAELKRPVDDKKKSDEDQSRKNQEEEIQKLKKELARIKASKSYKLGKALAYPVRKIRKLVK